jgi:hypothetical protein
MVCAIVDVSHYVHGWIVWFRLYIAAKPGSNILSATGPTSGLKTDSNNRWKGTSAMRATG